MKIDWKKEYNLCLELAYKNAEVGNLPMRCYWEGRADGIRWFGENLDNCNEDRNDKEGSEDDHND